LLTTTGYYQVDLAYCIQSETTAIRNGKLIINDGTTDKIIFQMSVHQTSAGANANGVYQTVVFLGAGDSLKCTSDDDQVMMNVVTRQIADISGNLVNPT
jgi:phosphate-selective porin